MNQGTLTYWVDIVAPVAPASGWSSWWWVLVGALIMLVLLAGWLWRRRYWWYRSMRRRIRYGELQVPLAEMVHALRHRQPDPVLWAELSALRYGPAMVDATQLQALLLRCYRELRR